MLSFAEAELVEDRERTYPFGPPDPDAMADAQGFAEALSFYSLDVEVGRARLPAGGSFDGLTETVDVADYRYHRAAIGSQPFPSDAELERGDKLMGTYMMATNSEDTGAIPRVMAADADRQSVDWETACMEVTEAETYWAPILTGYVDYAPPRDFGSAHAPYVQAALRHRMVHATAPWQVRQARALAEQRGYPLARKGVFYTGALVLSATRRMLTSSIPVLF